MSIKRFNPTYTAGGSVGAWHVARAAYVGYGVFTLVRRVKDGTTRWLSITGSVQFRQPSWLIKRAMSFPCALVVRNCRNCWRICLERQNSLR